MNKRLAILTVAVILAVGMPGAPRGHDSAAARTRLVRKSYAVSVSCTSWDNDGTCQPPYIQEVRTSKVLRFEFIANPAHCTPIDVLIWVQSPTNTYYGPYRVAPGESTGVVDPGPEGSARSLFLWARDAPGGPCAEGPLSAWEGTLKVTTSQRVRR